MSKPKDRLVQAGSDRTPCLWSLSQSPRGEHLVLELPGCQQALYAERVSVVGGGGGGGPVERVRGR